MLLVVTLILAILLTSAASVAAYLFSFDGWVIHVPIIVATYASLRRPFFEAALVVLVVTYLSDLANVGPPGLLQLIMTVVFFAIFKLALRFGGRPLLVGLILCALGSFAADLLFAVAFKLHYPTLSPFEIFASTALPTAFATAVFFIPYYGVLNALERILSERRRRQISFEG